MNFAKQIPIVCALLTCSSLGGFAQTPPLEPATQEQIIERVETEMQEKGIPGLGVAVGVGNQLVWQHSFGLADVEHSVPVKTGTRFRTASIAKPMSAMLILRLSELGRLDLDAPIQEYCPEFPEKRWNVTTRALLCHQGGVRHYNSSQEASDTRHFRSLTAALKVFSDDPLLHEPGTKYKYSSFGYNLLGSIAEGAGEGDFLELLEEHVLAPAEMTLTRSDNHFAIIPDRSRGYIRPSTGQVWRTRSIDWQAGELYRASLHDTSMKIPGGGLVSTPGDLVRFALALNRHELLRAETLDMAWQAQKLRDGSVTTYGLGWSVGQLAGHQQISHGGSQAGTATYLALYPKQQVSVAVMSNLQGSSVKSLTQDISNLIME